MATDLTQVPDHPAKILLEEGQVLGALVLRTYEGVKEGTFAFLDNAALAAVRETYETHLDTPYVMESSPAALRDLLDAVGNLLGLGDG